MTRSYDERREALKVKRAQLEAQMRDLDQSEAVARRKREAHCKILAGAAVLSAVLKDDRVHHRFMQRLDEFLTRPRDRALFDLPEHPPGSPERVDLEPAVYSRTWMEQ